MDLIIGHTYEVSCAELRWDDGRIYHVPVIDHCHADPQFGFAEAHYHIDGRFEMEPRMRHQLQVADGQTLSVIVQKCALYELVGIRKKMQKCTGITTGLRLPGTGENFELYRSWYQTFLGKDCKGRRCPHFGTEMLEKDGQLVCPLHHLVADLQTLKVIPL